METWVYHFEQDNRTLLSLLGGKGTGLAEMSCAGLPVPPGFTITTAACKAYYRLFDISRGNTTLPHYRLRFAGS